MYADLNMARINGKTKTFPSSNFRGLSIGYDDVLMLFLLLSLLHLLQPSFVSVCPCRWRIGDFGVCSVTCGGGLMSREVTCVQEVSRVVDKVLTLPDFMCQKPVPQRVRECNTQFCPANWATGFWSEVSH